MKVNNPIIKAKRDVFLKEIEKKKFQKIYTKELIESTIIPDNEKKYFWNEEKCGKIYEKLIKRKINYSKNNE